MTDRICDYCGGDIIFRWMGHGVVPIHLSGSCVQSDTYRATSQPSVSPPQRASDHWRIGHARSDAGERITHPTRCPVCHALIFFHTNGYGDVVFFDDLGPPWPKHPCLTSEDSYRRASTSVELMRLVDARTLPTAISMPAPQTREHAAAIVYGASYLNRTLTGLVLTRAARRVTFHHRGHRPSHATLFLTDIGLATGATVRVYAHKQSRAMVGDVVRIRLAPTTLDGRRTLYVSECERLEVPGDAFRTSRRQRLPS